MQILGVSAQTLYAYVSRKGIRSQPIPGSRRRRYWRADIELLGKKMSPTAAPALDVKAESEITLITEHSVFYRGNDSAVLAQSASLETVAALLWNVDETTAFKGEPPAAPTLLAVLNRNLADVIESSRVSAMFPLLEDANSLRNDSSRLALSRSGAGVLRWLAAIMFHDNAAASLPLHRYISGKSGLGVKEAELVRQVLVLSADHGFDSATVVARSLASAGASLWISVAAALSVTQRTRIKFENVNSIYRFLSEILAEADPCRLVRRRVRQNSSVPGFGSTVYQHGDPRAQAVLHCCADIYQHDTDFAKLQAVIAEVNYQRGLNPNFALLMGFCSLKLGYGSSGTLFHIGRAAGWIAHAIEQKIKGSATRQRGLYRGRLPD